MDNNIQSIGITHKDTLPKYIDKCYKDINNINGSLMNMEHAIDNPF